MNTYFSDVILNIETSLKDYKNYPYIDVILCNNNWFFCDFDDGVEYEVSFNKNGTFLMECVNGERMCSWSYDQKNNLFTFNDVKYEVTFIDKKIIIFKVHVTGQWEHQPDPYYFHLISSENPIGYCDYKADIEYYVTEVIDKEKDELYKFYKTISSDPFELTIELLQNKFETDKYGRKIDFGSYEYKKQMHSRISEIKELLVNMLDDNREPFEALEERVSVLKTLYAEGLSDMLWIIHEIYELEKSIQHRLE